ncbi:hypothetical protein OIU78_024817 [Salix suchowensis]|nr:hypothetical protein OIU78_024817 [Salix suchowensis]
MEDIPANSGNTQNLDSRTSDFHRPSKSPPSGIGGFGSQTMIRPEKCGTGLCEISENGIDEKREGTKATHQNFRNYFSYDLPHYEETGFWIPVSVPPMIESDCEEWADRGDFHFNGGYFPEGDMGWSQYIGEDSELTMWDVIVEMVHAARGKVNAIASGDLQRCGISWLSSHFLEQAWQEMAQTLNEANFCNVTEILEAEPAK